MFDIVPASEWLLSERVTGCRRERLLNTSFADIVSHLTGAAVVRSVKRKEMCKHRGWYRVEVSLQAPAPLVDLFHNGAGGYRAQFYLSELAGQRANRHVLNAFKHQVIGHCRRSPDAACPEAFVRASLSHWDAKAWIAEGEWLEGIEYEHRDLRVARWVASADSDDHPAFNKWFPFLAPAAPDRIEIKGGRLDADLKPSPHPLKPKRSKEINQFGFT